MPRLLRRIGDAFWVVNDEEGAAARYSRYELAHGSVLRGRLHDPKLFFLYNQPGYFIVQTDVHADLSVAGEALVSAHRFYQWGERAFNALFTPYVDREEERFLGAMTLEPPGDSSVLVEAAS